MRNQDFHKRIWLTRHGQTEHNVAKVMQGTSDSPLTDFGRKQISALAKRLDGWSFDHIYSSPLTRCRETTGSLLHLSKNVSYDERLIERCFGIFEGKPFKEALEYATNMGMGLDECTPENGESFNDVVTRVSSLLSEIYESDHSEILIVSHGTTTRALLTALLHLDPSEAYQIAVTNCSLSLVELKGIYTTKVIINDSDHLPLKD